MATVFMKWLETSPRAYDRGIQLLTLGRLSRVRQAIVGRYVVPGMRVLDIGCGTGTLSALMANQGATVTAIDASRSMLAVAEKRIAAEGLEERVSLQHLDATQIGDRFAPHSFDLIVATLVFSELSTAEQRYVLDACLPLLAPGGRLLIGDEVTPSRRLARLIYYLVRGPLVLLTWLLTRTTTSALRDFSGLLHQAGYRTQAASTYLGRSLVLYDALPAGAGAPVAELPAQVRGRLRHRVSARTLLLDLWGLFFRILPPYPKLPTGLYAIGTPGPESPILVTGNFDLTVRRVVRAIDEQVDAWLLVADSSGINVWCAAGGGYFTAEKVIAAVRTSRLDEVVRHRALVLPQLCANGVDGWRVREATGWGVHWGPARAADIPAYLAARRKKTAAMRLVRFPLKDRLEMVTVTLGFYGLLILVPVLLFWQSLFWPVAATLLGLSYFYAVVHPWLPGRDGLVKGIPLTIIALAGLFVFTSLWNPMPGRRLFNWTIGLTALSVFTAAELQGMSPLMRGEQANWSWEAAVGAVLGLLYWLAPLALGWR